MPYRSVWWTLGWLLVAVVAYLSLTSQPPDTGVENGDKYGHLLAYLSLMAWWGQLSPHRNRLLLLFILMGALLEGIQGLIPERQTSLADLVANSSGALLGWLATRTWPAWLPALAGRLATRQSP